MSATLTQISNVFNLITQSDPRLESYHFGWRSDINKNIYNNFDPRVEKGRMFPAVMFEPPEKLSDLSEPEYNGTRGDIDILLYFDNLQDYNNDGSTNTSNLIEQWDYLLKLARDYMANLVQVIGVEKYNIANISTNPVFVPRSNLHNQKLITIEVSFTLQRQIPCVDDADKIDLDNLPNSINELDIENFNSVPLGTTCEVLLSQISEELKLNCILPTYDFEDQDVRDATTAKQQTDMTTWLCAAPSDPVTHSLTFTASNNSIINIPDNAIFNFERTDSITFTGWAKISSYHTGMLFSKYSGMAPIDGFHIRVDSDGSLFFFMSAGNGNFIRVKTGVSVLPLNTWFHWAFVYDGTSLATGVKMYVDGFLQTNNILSPAVTASILNNYEPKIGATEIGTFDFNGQLVSFRFWDRALSQAEILADMVVQDPPNPTNLQFAPDFGPLALWDGYNGHWVLNDLGPNNIESAVTDNITQNERTTDIPV